MRCSVLRDIVVPCLKKIPRKCKSLWTLQSCRVGRLLLRCLNEEQVFKTVKRSADEVRGNTHLLQCPCILASGAPASLAARDALREPPALPRAACTFAGHCLDAAYLMFPGASHFMPFERAADLAQAVLSAFAARGDCRPLREHIRWMGVDAAQAQDVRLLGLL